MVKLIVAGAIAWPVLLGAIVIDRSDGHGAGWTAIVDLAASRICHQRSDRSFHTGGERWPVCARCSGLYAGGPIGAVMTLGILGKRRRTPLHIGWVIAAAAPTAITVALEWTGAMSISNTARFLAALPLGAVIVVLIVGAASGMRARTNVVSEPPERPPSRRRRSGEPRRSLGKGGSGA